MSNQSTPAPIYKVIGTVAAVIIGIDCAINAWYYLFLMGGVFANPVLIIFCATAGFILNSLLYKRDFPGACENLVNSICSWFSWQTYQNASFDHIITQALQEVIALSSALATGLFTYYSYINLAIPHLTLPWIIILSIAYIIGVYGLVRESCNFGEMAQRIKTVWEKRHDSPWTIGLILGGCALLLATYIAGTVWTVETITAGATAAILPLLPTIGLFMPWVGVFFLFGECLFVINTTTETIESCGSKPPHLTMTLATLLLLALANAIGNAAITAADSGLMLRAIIGGILSFGVMMQASFSYVDDNRASASWWSDADQMSLVVLSILSAIWGYMEWVAPLIPLPSIAVIAILVTSCLAITYLASPPISALFINASTQPELSSKQVNQAHPSLKTPGITSSTMAPVPP